MGNQSANEKSPQSPHNTHKQRKSFLCCSTKQKREQTSLKPYEKRTSAEAVYREAEQEQREFQICGKLNEDDISYALAMQHF